MDNQEFDAIDITIPNQNEFDKYQQIWVACTEQMDAESQQRLLDYVYGGGHLICFPTLPKIDFNGNTCTILADGLSVQSDEIFTESNGMIRWAKTNSEIHAVSYIETFKCRKAETIAVTRDDKTCGIKVLYGKGSASILGTGFVYQASAHKNAWQNLSMDNDFKSPVKCDNPLIITRTRWNKEKGGYFFMLNYNNQPIETTVSLNNQKIRLEPFSGTILPFDNFENANHII
jgi:beta-galactosidase